jgi:undecaprenyl-diphosphatase
MIFTTQIANKYTIVIFSIILLLLLIFHKKDYIRSKIFALTIMMGVILSQLFKLLIKRIRPPQMLIEKSGFSFPSGHATLSMAFFGILIYLFSKEIKSKIIKYFFITINSLLIILIGFSRLYLNVHWLTDVLAGYLLGLFCIYISIPLGKKIHFHLNKKNSKKK